MSVLLQLSLSIGTPIMVMFITTIAIAYEDFPYYKKTYNFLYKGEYISIRDWGGQITFIGNLRKECIGFEDGSIKLINDGYIHSGTPMTLFNPYALYYKRKINKVIKQIRIMETREEDRQAAPQGFYWREVTTEMAQQTLSQRLQWDVSTRRNTQQKPKDFKFLTKNQ